MTGMTDSSKTPDSTSATTPPLATLHEEGRMMPSSTSPKSQSKKTQSSIGACDACRLRKVRCLANESTMSSKCQRCSRANRECIYTTHSKTRRRKRTDTRVKELEEKVRGLSMMLEKRVGGLSHSSVEREILESTEEAEGDGHGNQKPNLATLAPTGGFGGVTNEGFSPFGKPTWSLRDSDEADATQAIRQSNESPFGPGKETLEPSPVFPDVIDRGILSMDKATELYRRYIDELATLYPAVVFPPDCTAARLRESKPILFLAMLAASAGASNPALNLRLNKEIQQVYATKVSIQGRKSMEIVQAMLLSILWTYPPDKFEDLKFHQQITQATTMALDLGLAHKPRYIRAYSTYDSEESSPSKDGGNCETQDNTQTVMSAEKRPDSSSIESRRTLLACYVFCASVSQSLRLPNMLRFTHWMEDCIDVLEHSPHAAPSDKRFVAWVRMQRISEECGHALSLDNPSESDISLADESTQAVLKSCEKRLSDWRRSDIVDKEAMNPFLEITYLSSNIYLHEIALHPDHDAEDFRPPFFIAVKLPSSQSQSTLTPPYINAIIHCISSAEALLNTFLGMTINEVLCSPTLVYVRIVYASVILIKLAISASMPSSELGKIIDRETNKIDGYLDNLLIHLRKAANLQQGGKHVLSSVFLRILTKLKYWFQHQKERSFEGAFGSESSTDANDPGGVMDDAQSWEKSTKEPSESTEPSRQCDQESQFSFAEPPPQTMPPTSTYQSQGTDKLGFFPDIGRDSIYLGYDNSIPPSVSQPLQPPSWGTLYQTNSNFMEPINNGFGYAMDQDPNLWTHLANAELDQNSPDNWMPDADSFTNMDYSSMSIPEFNWGTWPQQ